MKHFEPLLLKRLQNQKNQVEEAWEQEDFDCCILEFGPKRNSDGTKRLDVWTLKFKGRQKSDLCPGVYEVEIKIKPTYPAEHPECNFINGFKHYHVYTTGAICLPILKASAWKSERTIREVAEAIFNMVHSEPTLNDTANPAMEALYKKNPEDYKKMLRDQAKDFAKYG